MKNRNDRHHFTHLRSLVLISAFIIAVAVVAVPFYSARSSSLPTGGSSPASVPSRANENVSQVGALTASALTPRVLTSALLLPVPQSSPEAIYTYASNCTTSQTDFNLNDTVCAKANGVPVTLFPWRVLLIDPAGFVRNSQDAIPNDNATYAFALPSSATSIINGQTVDNRGTWRVDLVRANGSRRQSAAFTVHQTSNPVADVFAQKIARDESSVPTGGSIAFLLIAANAGPDTAQSVHLVDTVPSGATLVSFSQQSGPACLPAAAIDCTMTSLANGERAEFTAVYQVGGTPGTLFTTASVSSTTADPNTDNNSSTAQFEVTGGGSPAQCTLICPTNLTFAEDSPGSGGRTVHSANFPPPVTTGTCGAVSTTASPNPQTNDYFFPLGISVITASTESGETCTFTVTVTDNQNPTITSCPSDITTFESSPGSGSATVNYNVTASDNSGSVTITCNHPSGDSFLVGTTPVTCTATDEANNSSPACNFNVTVNAVNSTCVLTTQAPIVVDSPANACGTNVTYTTPTSDSGTCGTITCDHPPGFFPVGETVVTCTSSPDGGSTSFTVTVRDVTAPVPDLASLPTIMKDCTATAGIPTPTVIQTPTGPVTIIVMEPPTATDNCGGRIAGSTEDPRTYQDPGTFIVHWTYTDASGNTNIPSQDQTIVVTGDDTSPPTITAPGPVTFNTGPTATSCGVTIANLDVALGQAIANDSCSVADVELTGVPAGNVFPVGQTTLTYTATDASGHQASATQVVTVVDNTLPVLTAAPGPVTLYTGAGATSCGVTVTNLDAALGTGTGHDNCAFSVERLGLPAGNVFPVGPTTITYRAVDASGNHSATTATQLVTVVDNTPPTITAPANAGYQCPSQVPAANASQATASDNCVIPTVTVSETTNSGIGSTLSPLVITRTFTATDAANNSASAVQTITVIDNTPPVITCVADIIADFNPAVNGAVVTYTAPVGSDNCNGVTPPAQTAGLGSGSLFPLGTTTNTFMVTDAVGLTASCSFKVTVALTSIIGLNSVTITGSAYADSYSSAGGYPATKGSLANILSNGTITMGNSGKVWGNVRSTRAGVNMTGASQVTGNATAGTTVTTSNSATVGGTRTNNALAPVMTLPLVPACGPPYSSTSGITGTYSYNASTGDLTLSGVNIATLANGNYCFHNVTLGNSAQLKVNGPVVIKLTGTLNTSGATNLNNTTQIPSNLRILSSYSGSNGVILGNSANVYSVIYAPNTGVNISGSAPLFGTVAGKTITMGNSGAIHYDTTLKTAWPGIWTLIFGP